MQRHLFGLWLLLVAVLAPIAKADLYHITTCASPNATQDWQEGIRSGWQTVLVRISGNRHINTLDEIENATGSLEHTLEHFRYTQAPNQCPEEKPYRLELQFKAKKVKDFLAKYNQPIWPEPRVDLMVWVKIIPEDETSALYLDDQSNASIPLQTVAQARGIALRMPIMDLQDHITPKVDMQHQTYLSERYRIKHQLIGTLEQSSGFANWTLVTPNTHLTWQHHGAKSLEESLQSGLHHAIDVLAEQYRIDQNKALEETHSLVIHPIRSLQMLENLKRHLKQIPIIRNLSIQNVQNNSVEMKLSIQGSLQDLINRLHQDPHLKLDSQRLERQKITYIWQP